MYVVEQLLELAGALCGRVIHCGASPLVTALAGTRRRRRS
jgi:hypothetical protein